MRTTVVIKNENGKYFSSAHGKFGGGHTNARAGLTAYDAAAHAAEMMIKYAVSNDEGGDLMAPLEILDIVPQQLHSIDAKSKVDN
jgi:hypothetical protein